MSGKLNKNNKKTGEIMIEANKLTNLLERDASGQEFNAVPSLENNEGVKSFTCCANSHASFNKVEIGADVVVLECPCHLGPHLFNCSFKNTSTNLPGKKNKTKKRLA